MADILPPNEPAIRAAYDEGRRVGLATAALTLSIVAFINLLGLEKSALAIVLASLALVGASPATAAAIRARVRTAIAIGGVQIVMLLTLLVVFRDRLAQLIHLLQQLG
jgi:hypothetical protein